MSLYSGLNLYLARINASCSRTQHCDGCEARTRNPSGHKRLLLTFNPPPPPTPLKKGKPFCLLVKTQMKLTENTTNVEFNLKLKKV